MTPITAQFTAMSTLFPHTDGGDREVITLVCSVTSAGQILKLAVGKLSSVSAGVIDWGDGSNQQAFTSATISHAYATAGTYIVKVHYAQTLSSAGSANRLINSVSGASSLTSLSVYNQLLLTEIDLHLMPEITMLSCNTTAITSLDLSKSPKIRSVSCYRTSISAFNFQNCSKLSSLVCTNSTASVLDFSDCVVLGTLSMLDMPNISQITFAKGGKMTITTSFGNYSTVEAFAADESTHGIRVIINS